MTALLFCAALACERDPTPAPAPVPAPSPAPSQAPAPAPAYRPTSELVERPELATLVDALAKHARIESSHIGAAGAPSEVWAAWDAVRRTATGDELAALLRHESPVVRGYVARHRLRNGPLNVTPADLGWLGDVLRDSSAVSTTDGCMMGEDTLAAMAVEDLCYNAHDRAGAHAILAGVAAAERFAALHQRIGHCLPKKAR